jgi:hypothetical protein
MSSESSRDRRKRPPFPVASHRADLGIPPADDISPREVVNEHCSGGESLSEQDRAEVAILTSMWRRPDRSSVGSVDMLTWRRTVVPKTENERQRPMLPLKTLTIRASTA